MRFELSVRKPKGCDNGGRSGVFLVRTSQL